MKGILSLIILLNFSHAFSKCLCQLNLDNSPIYFGDTYGPGACYSKIESHLLKDFEKTRSFCADKMNLDFEWGCNQKLVNRTLSCKKLEEEFVNISLNSVMGLSHYANLPSQMEPQANANMPDGECNPDFKDVVPPQLNLEKIQYHVPSLEAMQEMTKDFIPGEILERPKDKWQFVFHLPNDNKGLGLLDSVFGKGNDEGNTHGMLVSISKAVGGGYHLTLEYKSNLYTKARKEGDLYIGNWDEDGTFIYDQYFLEDSFTKLILDNRDKDQAMYYSATLGWHKINEKDLGNVLHSTARQQQGWHSFLGSDLAAQYNYLPGEEGNREGVLIEAAVGVDKSIPLNQSFRIKTNAEAGVMYSGADKDASRIYGEATIRLDYQQSADSNARSIGATTSIERYRGGSPTIRKNKIFFEMGKESFHCGMGISKKWGDTNNLYTKYDNDDDLMGDVYCKSAF